jgi:hypothetical protein
LYCRNKSLGLGKGHRGVQENHEDDHGKTGKGEIYEIANTCNLQSSADEKYGQEIFVNDAGEKGGGPEK